MVPRLVGKKVANLVAPKELEMMPGSLEVVAFLASAGSALDLSAVHDCWDSGQDAVSSLAAACFETDIEVAVGR